MAHHSIPNPFALGVGGNNGFAGTSTGTMGLPQHGYAEQWRGTVFASDMGGGDRYDTSYYSTTLNLTTTEIYFHVTFPFCICTSALAQ